MMRLVHSSWRVAAVAVFALLCAPATSLAQLNGQNIKGDVGLKSGSQAPPASTS